MASLPQAREGLSAATLNNSVFVFGENNNFYCQSVFIMYSPGGYAVACCPYAGGSRDDILRFIPANNTWMDAGKMTTPRHAHRVALREVSDYS